MLIIKKFVGEKIKTGVVKVKEIIGKGIDYQQIVKKSKMVLATKKTFHVYIPSITFLYNQKSFYVHSYTIHLRLNS